MCEQAGTFFSMDHCNCGAGMFLFFKSERILERFVSLEYFKFLKDLVWLQVVMFFSNCLLMWQSMFLVESCQILPHILKRTFCTVFSLHKTSTVTVSCFLLLSCCQPFIVSFDALLEIWCAAATNLDSITVEYFMQLTRTGEVFLNNF